MRYRYGYFNEDGTEFIITNPKTPRAFDNFLWNDAVFSNVSQTGVGYFDYQYDDKEAVQLLTGVGRICDFDIFGRDHLMNRLIYVRDNETGEYWNVNWEPVKKEYENFESRQGMGYMLIKSKTSGISSELRIFVPKGKDPVELWTLNTKNESDKTRNLSIKDDYYHYLKEHGYTKYHASEDEGYFENKGAVVSKISLEHQVDKWVADRTCEFIENYDQDKPFALMVGFPGPHCPYDPPAELADMYDPDDMPDSIPETKESMAFKQDCIEGNKLPWNGVDYSEFTEKQKKKVRAHYSALISLIDQQVGRIIQVLKKKGIFENTIIIFSSDHGDYLGDYGMIGKREFYEPAVHIPLIVSHPDKREKQTVDSIVSLTDLYSTILSMAGLPYDEDNGDSVVLPCFNESDKERDYLFAPSLAGFMVAKGPYKYCRYHNGVNVLFDIEKDPTEQVNLIDDPLYKDVVKELDQIMIKEIFSSILAANDDKVVNRGGIVGEGPFGERGWKRTYP